jgi:hypothetical protein
MSALDLHALETNFTLWKGDRAQSLDPKKAFERYAIEHIFKDDDLSDEDIDSGNFGGHDDGGVDGMYFFINHRLVTEESDIPDSALTAELVLIQVAGEKSFKEEVIQKVTDFSRDLLNYSKNPDSFTYLNVAARDAIARFRAHYDKILATPHELTIRIYYVTKSEEPPNTKVEKRVEKLSELIKEVLSHAKVEFEPWSCKRLLDAARSIPVQTFTMKISKDLQSVDGKAAVCLAKLKSVAKFLTDERGGIRAKILEPNVRAYQGKSNPVNRAIRETLSAGTATTEFWWQNNGITLLAKEFKILGETLSVEKPEIVNGLQTSQEIYEYFHEHSDVQDDRHVLVRIIVPPDEQTRRKITRATNFQTKVDDLSLHATDQLHFDIEERLKLYYLFYDRRKGEYRNLRKPIDRIISMLSLARVTIAILLQQPENARGSPRRVLNTQYSDVFNDEYDRDFYVASVLLDRQVMLQLMKTDLSSDVITDVRYYVDTWLACELSVVSKPSAEHIAGLLPKVLKPIAEDIMLDSINAVLAVYKELGGTDRVAKSQDMRILLKMRIDQKFPPPPTIKGAAQELKES